MSGLTFDTLRRANIARIPLFKDAHGRVVLENYIRMHPKAAGARTLTQARIMAFGRKQSQHGIDKAENRRYK